MAFLLLNLSNVYDPSSISKYADVQAADAAARAVLANSPQARLIVVQELYQYSTSVTITAGDPSPYPEPQSVPAPEPDAVADPSVVDTQ